LTGRGRWKPRTSPDAVRAFVEPRIVKRWKPDRVIFDAVLLTATGKIDKKVLRSRYATALTG
jgi:acyl-CoA synthetase (AMP-forming)/AMP-acid ligase II